MCHHSHSQVLRVSSTVMVYTRSRYCLILLTCVSLLTIFLTLANFDVAVPQDNQQDYGAVKKIVAYSLLKQIERDSEEVECQRLKFVGESSAKNKSGWSYVEGTNLFVYNVYKDARLDPYYFIRIIGMVKGSWNSSIFCQIKTNEGYYHITRAVKVDIWSENWDTDSTKIYYNPVLFSCRIPYGIKPSSVIISKNSCDINSNNKFTLKNRGRKGKYFTVCVKPLNFKEDISRRLIEWIEINRIIGAEKIVIYINKINRNVHRILKWYSYAYPNEIEVIKFNQINESDTNTSVDSKNVSQEYANYIWQKRRYEVIVYNDCFYKNLENTKYIVPLDIDEIIVPLNVGTWKELLRRTFSLHRDVENNFASFSVSNAYYLREFTQHRKKEQVFFYADTTRSQLSENGESCKSFVSVKNTLTVFNHYALHTLKPGVYKTYFLPKNIVQMNHYKAKCSSVILPECSKYLSSPVRIFDPVIFKYKPIFDTKYADILKKLKNVV